MYIHETIFRSVMIQAQREEIHHTPEYNTHNSVKTHLPTFGGKWDLLRRCDRKIRS